MTIVHLAYLNVLRAKIKGRRKNEGAVHSEGARIAAAVAK